MHVPINVKSPNNISEWQMGFNSAFKGLNYTDKITLLFALYFLLYSLIGKQFPKSVSFLTRTIISGFVSIYNAYTGLIKTKINNVRAEMLIAVTNKIKVFYILIQCTVVLGYQRSDRILCLFRLGKTFLF
jgi:hypothetical protein